jgi:hypothetical protein
MKTPSMWIDGSYWVRARSMRQIRRARRKGLLLYTEGGLAWIIPWYSWIKRISRALAHESTGGKA